MMTLYFGIVLTLLSACAGTPKTQEEISTLDIVSPDEGKAKVFTLDTKSTDGRVPVDVVFNWQQFFKQLPSAKERKAIAQTLKAAKSENSAASLLKRARNEAALGLLGASETTYREVLRNDSENLDATLELATLYLNMEKVNHAFEMLSQVRDGIGRRENADKGFVFRYRYSLSLALLARGDRKEGRRILSDLIAQEKSFVPAYAALASSYLAQNRDEVAEFVTKRGIDRAKEDAVLLNILGIISDRRGRNEEAREWFNRALKLSDTYVPALINRASLNVRQLDYDLAEADLKTALELNPLNVDAWVTLGVVQQKTGRFEDSKQSYEKALDLNIEHPMARFNLAVLMADKLKDPNAAVRLFSEVLQTKEASSSMREMAKSYIDDLKTAR